MTTQPQSKERNTGGEESSSPGANFTRQKFRGKIHLQNFIELLLKLFHMFPKLSVNLSQVALICLMKLAPKIGPKAPGQKS